MKIKNTTFITTATFVTFALVGCVGGNDVSMPDTLEPIPVQEPFDPNGSHVKGETAGVTLKTVSSANLGDIVSYQVEEPYWPGSTSYITKTKFFYKTKTGEIYPFSEFSVPMIPDFSAPDKNYFTTQNYQPTSNGGKIFACCNNSGVSPEGIYTDNMRYGIWIDPDGQANFFVGGIEAEAEKLQGAKANNGQPTGKVTYHVWAFRNKGGKVTASSYLPKSWGVDAEDVVASELTVNFNTGKLGGNIIGNNDFGADISFDDVDVEGNTFSGIASSGGHSGAVKGAFFGQGGLQNPDNPPSYWNNEVSSGKEIGGVVTFAGHQDLDSVFGGSRAVEDATDTSTDLTPLKK